MAKKVDKDVKCRIISSAAGPSGKSVGRICIARYIQTGAEHTLWGEVWVVEQADGRPFDRIPHDGILPDINFCHCPEDWLEPLEDEEPPAVQETREVELTN